MAHPEHDEQVASVQWFRLTYNGVRIAAIPNGVYIAKASSRAFFKAEGKESGVPDLVIPAWFVWVEMKKKGYRVGKTLTDTELAQQDWQQYLRDCGYHVFQCAGFDEFRTTMEEFSKNRTFFGMKNTPHLSAGLANNA